VVLGRTLLGLLARHGVPLEQIHVLSPFRAVVRECRTVARNTLRAAFEHDGLADHPVVQALDDLTRTDHRSQRR